MEHQYEKSWESLMYVKDQATDGLPIYEMEREKNPNALFQRVAPSTAQATDIKMDDTDVNKMAIIMETEFRQNLEYFHSVVDAAAMVAWISQPNQIIDGRLIYTISSIAMSMKFRGKLTESRQLCTRILESIRDEGKKFLSVLRKKLLAGLFFINF